MRGAHHVEIVKPDALGILPDLVKHYGEPFGDSSAVPTYYVCQLARQHVPMVLSGDGGDESFGGYWSHGDWMAAETARRRGLRSLGDWLKFIQYVGIEERRRLWRPEHREVCPAPLEAFVREYERAAEFSLGHQVQYLDLRTYLPFDILTKVDIASMMHGLEVRTPLVDVKVIELAARIPDKFHLARGANGQWERKLLLKRVAARHFPTEFANRPKMGFAVPIAKWFAPGGALHSAVAERLLARGSMLHDYFEPSVMQQMIARNAFGPLWLLLFLDEWLRQNKASAPVEATPRPIASGSALVTQTSNGVTFELDLNQYIDKCIYADGCFEPPTARALARLVQPGMTVLDIGANIGAHAFPLAQRVGACGRVIAFEPMEWALRKFRRNAQLNRFDNVTLEKAVLSNENGVVNVAFRSSWPLDGSDSTPQTESLPAHRLDDYLAARGIAKVDVIKLDVDGYEFKVLQGASDLLRRCHPALVMELGIYTLEAVGDRAEAMLDFLADHGYTIHLETDLATPVADKQELIAQVPANSTINIVCVPQGFRMPAADAPIETWLSRPAEAKSMIEIAEAYIQKGDTAAAHKCLEVAIEVYPNDAEMRAALDKCRRAVTTVGQSQSAVTRNGSARRPHILMIADVPNWIFARHCRTLARFLSDDFNFTILCQGVPFREADFDLIYPLEWNLVPAQQIRTPAKYITSIRSHTAWQNQDFLQFVDFLGSRFQQVHVVSRRLQRIFEPFLPSVSCVSHGVDTEFFTPSTRADQSGRKLRLGWAGNRASPAKGFEQFIAPLGRLPGVELAFCGFQDRNLSLDDMRAFYNSLDTYVCSSSLEGNNNSLLEAAAIQRAIITTDNGAVPEYLRHGESAFIVERELPHFMQAVIALRDDPARRVAMDERARVAVIRSFDWKNMAQHYRALFWDALTHKNSFNGEAKAARRYIELKSGPPVPSELSAAYDGGAKEPEHPDPLAEAEAKVREALAINPNGLEALKALAHISLQRGHWLECAQNCARVLEQTPDDLEVNLIMAKCFFQAGDVETTRLVLNRVLELQADNVMAKENLAALDKLNANAAQGTLVQPANVQTDQAERSLGSQSEADPTPSAEESTSICPGLAAELEAAAAALQRQDLAEAYTIYQRALKTWPEHDALREVVGNVSSLLREVTAPKGELPVTPAKINVAILTHNALEYTKLCLASLTRHTPFPYNVFIVDNASTDDTPAWLAARTEANLFCELSPINLGVPGGRNRLLQLILPHLPPDGFVVFMDNDIEVLPGWAEFYLDFFAQHPEAGLASAVGHPFIVQGDSRELLAAPVGKPTPVEVACGGFTCWMRAETIRAVGWFDECLGLFWHEDDDYSVRALSQGFEVYALPGAPVLHYEHKSGVANPGLAQGGLLANQKYLVNKWRRMGCVDAGGRIIHPKQKALPTTAQRGTETPPTEPERGCSVARAVPQLPGQLKSLAGRLLPL